MKSNITPYSNLKIFAHPEKLEQLKRNENPCPIYIRIKPTNICNHNCAYCHYRSPYLDLDQYHYEDSIPRDKMVEIVESMADMGVKAVTFSGGGEPLLYPFIEETMKGVISHGIDLSIITNGSLLEGEKAKILAHAKWVRISMESACDETYCGIRGIKKGSFYKLCENIKNFAEIKDRNCELGINFVIGSDNYHEVYDAGRLMKELGADHIKFTAQISDKTEEMHKPFKNVVLEQIHKLMEEQQGSTFKIINLYEGDFDNSVKLGRTYETCYIKDFVCVIAANAKVYLCHDKAYMKQGEIGDLCKQTLQQLWNSEEKRIKFESFSPMSSCKHHCVYDDRNILLNSYFSLDENHIHFI